MSGPIHGHGAPKASQHQSKPESFSRSGLSASEQVESSLRPLLKEKGEERSALVEAHKGSLKNRKLSEIGSGRGHGHEKIGNTTAKVANKAALDFKTILARETSGRMPHKKANHVRRPGGG